MSNPNEPIPDIDADALFQALRRKEGTWIEWGTSCEQLQKAGHTAQAVFEATGFEPILQNQLMVGAQVYGTLVQRGAAQSVIEHFSTRGSEILYELRVLGQEERVSASELVYAKKSDIVEVREIVKAIKDFSRLGVVPEGFSTDPGDIVAYQAWKSARQEKKLEDRARYIARGLSYAHSESARRKLEELLTDFAVVTIRKAPRLPIYRLDSEEELPCLLPVVGQYPVTKAALRAAPLVEEEGPFKIVTAKALLPWVAIPGWQVVRLSEDPVAIVATTAVFPEDAPGITPGPVEPILLVIDRADREWDADSYFLVEQEGQAELQWLSEESKADLLGRLVLILRPKRFFDEEAARDLWQIDE
jgi:Rubisco Assembly chaperone C-terminal domain/Rubisco accumulation factor 1 alpha helical domain/Rubisco accumulation factor 1 helix turn helix domain